eukprot:14427040-Alexandrium_andersonii.AAC.1
MTHSPGRRGRAADVRQAKAAAATSAAWAVPQAGTGVTPSTALRQPWPCRSQTTTPAPPPAVRKAGRPAAVEAEVPLRRQGVPRNRQ